ncbi:MAG: hypothetical protein PHW96_04570 [Candidatus Nanoarchaeia archaeon]|nr:hypothetical protein [Candidatus Nanoarchaeia archaeon]
MAKNKLRLSPDDAWKKYRKMLVLGNALLVVGALWGLKELGYIAYIFGITVDTLFWPLVFMFGGILFLAKSLILKKRYKI